MSFRNLEMYEAVIIRFVTFIQTLSRFRWFGHMLRLPVEGLPRYIPFSEAGNGEEMGHNSQSWFGTEN